MEFVKSSVLYNTESSTKIGGPVTCSNRDYCETLYLSKNEQYYLFIIRGCSPADVKTLSEDEAFRWATAHLAVDTVKDHFAHMLREA